MTKDEPWQQEAARLAELLEAHADEIYAATSTQLAKTFPALCLDQERVDAERFQQTTFRQSPRRLHRLLIAALRLGSLSVLEREYRWLIGVVTRYGVEMVHLQAMAGWYFNAARSYLSPGSAEWRALMSLKRAVLAAIAVAHLEEMHGH